MQTIAINWQDDNSIKKAERRKAFLENKGYTLIETTYGAMRSSGLIKKNFKIMTELNKKQKLSVSTEPAISYSTCYLLVRFI